MILYSLLVASADADFVNPGDSCIRQMGMKIFTRKLDVKYQMIALDPPYQKIHSEDNQLRSPYLVATFVPLFGDGLGWWMPGQQYLGQQNREIVKKTCGIAPGWLVGVLWGCWWLIVTSHRLWWLGHVVCMMGFWVFVNRGSYLFWPGFIPHLGSSYKLYHKNISTDQKYKPTVPLKS